MQKELNIPFGSQHIALLEPLRFNLITENEKIKDVEFDFGYVHRGVEKACTEKFKFRQVGYVVARVCGLCAITHTTSYTLAVEDMLGVQLNKRIDYLRMIVLEMDRIHSHMLCLSHTAESAGYEALFMRIMRDRELIMQGQEALTGGRVQFDFVSIGGVNRDLTPEITIIIKDKLTKLKELIKEIKELFLNNWSLSLRYKGVGILKPDMVKKYSTVGVLARAGGYSTDVRFESKRLPYDEIGFKVIIEQSGDIYARNMVRIGELFNSVEMIENIINNLPEGEINIKVKGKPNGESVAHIEAPRGELLYYLKGNNSQYLDRVRIKTPTYSNIPAMIEIFKGEEYSSVPAILASFDPCLSCTAK